MEALQASALPLGYLPEGTADPTRTDPESQPAFARGDLDFDYVAIVALPSLTAATVWRGAS